MFLGPGELEIADESQAILATLTDISDTRTITLFITVHLRAPGLESRSAPLLDISIKHPTWLSRADYERLLASLPSYTGSPELEVQGAEDGRDWLMQIIEYFDSEDTKKSLLADLTNDSSTTDKIAPPTRTAITRAWFYLPSLSTRSKRDDMVRLAQIFDHWIRPCRETRPALYRSTQPNCPRRIYQRGQDGLVGGYSLSSEKDYGTTSRVRLSGTSI
ncbi:hypothetical protein RhiXN_03347 [Rhizoctonia solani]|uniref:Uncharacterized protein n=1 Tax=Rhizoctonia solani TaxID=456999 RepID=A0A8H8NTC9_9AGAM|nr:uncharacterized protein RhiXN_03347 [Rhizoctonia solani]QRW18423.1 hypothetical protein RhiXN_03347 [Rhizoctonia solani]